MQTNLSSNSVYEMVSLSGFTQLKNEFETQKKMIYSATKAEKTVHDVSVILLAKLTFKEADMSYNSESLNENGGGMCISCRNPL